MPPIYLDHNATSPVHPEALEAMLRALHGGIGNPSSPHVRGREARRSVESAREWVARLIKADPEEIVFTSGGTESNNLALHGALGRPAEAGGCLVTSAIEHPSVLGPIEELEGRGAQVVRVRPTRDGVVEAAEMLRAAGENTRLVSLMLANNEVGALQPVRKVGTDLRRRGVLFHSDASQAAGRVSVDVEELQVDLLTISGHKFGAPLGSGALYVRRGVTLRPHLRGGSQELNRRPGTENVAAIVGFGAAARAAERDREGQRSSQEELRELLEIEALRLIPGSRVNGRNALRLPNTSSLAFEGTTGESLVIGLDLEGIAVSSGSACSTGTIKRSHVLEAMGLREESGSSIRVSLGPATTREEIDTLVRALTRVVDRVRSAAGVLAVREGA